MSKTSFALGSPLPLLIDEGEIIILELKIRSPIQSGTLSGWIDFLF
jgi:hypothetical protein